MTTRVVVRVRDVMKREVDIIDGMMTVGDALKGMRYVENKAMVVQKRHADDEYGMLLLTDVARKVLATDRPPERVSVYEVMAKPVITVRPEMDIRYCARLFDRFGITRAPVIEVGMILGMVSFTDLVLRGLIGRDRQAT